VTLKWAQSADGFLAPLHKNEQKPVWLSNEYSRQISHKLRTEHQSILVGGNTVLQDNPSLTARDWKGKNPIRIVVDSKNNLPKELTAFDEKAKTIVLVDSDLNEKFLAKAILEKLYKQNIQSVLVEGGAKTLRMFLNENLWDEAIVFETAVYLNNGVAAPVFKRNPFFYEKLETDQILKYKNHD
jgi:diaminohydroxyphosphoribosylaminopyrimidine deaminase / 5-amino-6-(5-phosphoribosylamino)uracil reductase